MAKGSGLTSVNQALTATHKLLGPAMAGVWSRSATPPLSSDKAGYYAAALEAGASGESRGRIARCLLWCDAEAGVYCPARLPWYKESALAFPNDERSAFFVATLCYAKVYKEPDLTSTVYPRVLRAEWQGSPYWVRFDLPQRTVLSDLARLYASDRDTITPERVGTVEDALERAEDKNTDKKLLAAYLCRAYREAGRTDETAEIVYRYIFNHEPEDADNNLFLARLYDQKGRSDASACAVFARMSAQAQEQGDAEADGAWSLRLARAYISLGRVDEGTLATFRRAAAAAPGDRDVAAALLCATARRRPPVELPETVALYEDALRREAEVAPLFEARHWDWSVVVRALAVAYGQRGRMDEETAALYARAARACPGDREVWAIYARSLAARADYGPEALEVYEHALDHGVSQADDSVALALGRAYVENGAHAGPRRSQAVLLWETLYRQGQASPEMVQALAKGYAAEDRANDIALSLWAQAVEADAKNGPLRLRLAQEWRQRGDYDTALRYYKEAAKLLPKDFVAQFEAGVLLADHFSDYPGAIRLLQKAVKLPAGQGHLAAHFALGEALLARDKRDEAKAIFQKIADDIDANHTPTLLHLAKLNLRYEEQGLKKAEALYEQAKTLDPDHPETYRRMADLYREQGDTAAEEEALERYLELSEPDADRYRQLADLYIRRGDFLRAEAALRQVIALGRGDKRLYTLLGEVILQGRAQAA